MHGTHNSRAAGPQGIFSNNQPVYASHGVATFPVTQDKIPAIRGYQHVGLPGSAKLAQKFQNANALGFIAGRRSRITVLDIDTPDENVLADALVRHGESNLVIQTGSGKWHAYYRWGGELRLIRPDSEIPIDIIGGGVAIAPPSMVMKGSYKIIQGHIDNLDRLLLAKGLKDVQQHRQKSIYSDTDTGLIHKGRRSEAVWRHCMKNAKYCDNLEAVHDVALTFDANSCMPPIAEDAGGERRLFGIAKSAWDTTERGMNRFGLHGVFFPDDELSEMIAHDSDALILLGFLRSHNGPCATFMCTNTVAEKIGCGGRTWSHERVAAARSRLVDLGYLTQVKNVGKSSPALFKWTPRR
jgi:hypothetical protein